MTIGLSANATGCSGVYEKFEYEEETQRYLNTGAPRLLYLGDILIHPQGLYISAICQGTSSSVRDRMNKSKPGQTWLSMYNMACVQSGFMGAV